MSTKRTAQAAVTESALQSVLRKGSARELAPVEERAMRMRLGATLPRKAQVEWVGRGNEDLEIELLAFEIEAYLKLKDRQARRAAPAVPPTTSRTKERIIRALRRKGPTR
jgi:hypothetical protein